MIRMNLKRPLKILPAIYLMISAAILLFCNAHQVDAQSTTGCSPGIENSQALATSLHVVLPSHLEPMYPLETYVPSNLYEAINGQADQYLKAGFVKLTTQRLQLIENTANYLEINIYQMNRHLSAFAVYSGQRRQNAIKLDMTSYAYKARNAMFFVHGCFYIEIIGSNETDPLISVMQQFAQAFVDQHPVQTDPIPELSIFPTANLLKDSVTLFPEGALGFEQFKDVFLAEYNVGDSPVTVFISRCRNPSETVNLSEAYQAYLLEFDGELQAGSTSIKNGKLIRLHDMFELVFTHKNYIAGVHQAPTQTAAETLAQKLSAALSKHIR